jgi:starvation-inducible outer membrane lipoprotein
MAPKKMIAWILGMVVFLGLASCTGSLREYPTAAVKDSDPNIEFRVLRAAPETYKGKLIQLAGEIIAVRSQNPVTVIEAQRKWIMTHPEYPGYRPLEVGGDPADLFILVYPGRIDPGSLMLGNKFITAAELFDSPKAREFKITSFRARCLHVWKTGEKKITFFADRYTQVYAPLEQETFCVKGNQSVP